MTATPSTEELYDIYPNHLGNAVAEPQKWESIYDWMAEKYSEALHYAQAWHVESETLEDYYDKELKDDGYYLTKSTSDCDCCGENIRVGTRMFSIRYPDGNMQQPLDLACAEDCLEGEAVDAAGGNVLILVMAKVVRDVIECGYWNVLSWVIEHKVQCKALGAMLRFNPEDLKDRILKNTAPGGME